MHFEDVGFIGWIHGLACGCALLTGAWNMVVFDRGRWRQLRDKVYAWSMVAANLLVFAILDFDISFTGPPGAGVFGFFHWLAAGALFFTLLGWFGSTRQRHGVWGYVHPVSMVLSYYVLAGGLANELFARVDALRPLATTLA